MLNKKTCTYLISLNISIERLKDFIAVNFERIFIDKSMHCLALTLTELTAALSIWIGYRKFLSVKYDFAFEYRFNTLLIYVGLGIKKVCHFFMNVGNATQNNFGKDRCRQTWFTSPEPGLAQNLVCRLY